MAEVRALNLGGQQYDPLRGISRPESNVSWAEKQRRSSEAAMNMAVAKYKIKGLERAEKDYILNKKAENYIFSNYPSGKKATIFNMNSLDFLNEDSRSKKLKDWKEKVGGNLQAFEQYYQAGKKAELNGVKRSLIRDRKKFSEDGWSRHVTEYLNSLDTTTRSSFMSQLDDETLSFVNQFNTPETWRSLSDVGESFERFKYGSPKLTGIGSAIYDAAPWVAGAGGAYYGYRKLKKGDISSLGGLKDKGLKLFGMGSKKAGAKETVLSAEELLKYTSRGAGKKGIKGTLPGSNLKAKRTKAVNVIDDIINPNQVGSIQKGINSAVKDGKFTQKMGDQLKSAINKIMNSGKDFTTRNLHNELIKLGSKGEGLRTAINTKKIDLGPIKGLGMMKTLGISALAGAAFNPIGSGAASVLGASEHNQDVYGDFAGTAAGTAAFFGAEPVYKKLQRIIQKRGAPAVMSQVAKKGGVKLASKIAGKSLLSLIAGIPTMGWGTAATAGLVAYDVYALYDLLSELE